jgi:thioredoxin reductase
VHIGLGLNIGYLESIVPLTESRQVEVNEWMEMEIPGVFAAGDIQSNSSRQVPAGVGEGVAAGMVVERYLRKY